MADAINTGNPTQPKFIVNKYDDIDGSRVNQETPRGRLCFRDTNGRMTIPRDATEALKAVFPVDWAKPLNPPPYYDGAGLNGALPNVWNDGSLDNQENDFEIDPDVAFVANWPTGVKAYDLPPAFYNLPVTSGNKALVYDGGTFTYSSGNYVGTSSDFALGAAVWTATGTAATTGGMLTASGSGPSVGRVVEKDTYGQNTITVKLKGIGAAA